MIHAHALHDKHSWSRLTAAELKTNLVLVLPNPRAFHIHSTSPCSPSSLGLVLHPAQDDRAHQKMSHYSLAKVTPSLFPPAPIASGQMMAEALHCDDINLRIPLISGGSC